jgi:hypothetical protein
MTHCSLLDAIMVVCEPAGFIVAGIFGYYVYLATLLS